MVLSHLYLLASYWISPILKFFFCFLFCIFHLVFIDSWFGGQADGKKAHEIDGGFTKFALRLMFLSFQELSFHRFNGLASIFFYPLENWRILMGWGKLSNRTNFLFDVIVLDVLKHAVITWFYLFLVSFFPRDCGECDDRFCMLRWGKP